MRKTIDSLEFTARNTARITWTAGPSDETNTDTAASYATTATHTDITLTTGGLVAEDWIGAAVTVGGTSYGIVANNGTDWVRIPGDASVEGALAAVVLTAPEKLAYVYVNGFQVDNSPVDTDAEELEFEVADAFNVELHELPVEIGSTPTMIPYTFQPYLIWSYISSSWRYLIYRKDPDASEEEHYQMEPHVDSVDLFEVQTITDLILEGAGWNWFKVEAKSADFVVSARSLWSLFVKALPDQPTDMAAVGTSPNITITLLT